MTDRTDSELTSRWIAIAVTALFGVIYAYYLWDAIRSMIELPAQYELVGLGRENAPWTLLVAGVILPVVVYIAALIVGARRGVAARALILLVGLGALACLSLSVIALG
ncbi:hypothetical protein B0I08_103312 [Glaciihabitans tibetensis]|uniref:Uncharacterized protein n=1 Tax=Glaciihabitans tibetensis TaxID=1266600 RepID=A0A2T0VG09_9MICO|nr:hypothetical protein [Glaciihabitans tibetensis]PRY69106.1 hypothetical protein B0I08_103312 [Glaciihabitans tibetensis]